MRGMLSGLACLISSMLEHFTDEALIAELERRGVKIGRPLPLEGSKCRSGGFIVPYERVYYNEDQPELTGLKEHGGA